MKLKRRILDILQTCTHRFAVTQRQRKNRQPRLESLEGRQLFATLVSPTTLTFKDVDSDWAQVTFSAPILTPANVNSVFKFDVGSVNGSNSAYQQLQSINLDSVRSSGVTISVRAIGNSGDGYVNVGQVVTQQSLEKVSILGDLGRIVAGSVNVLQAGSLGKFGTRTGAENLRSRFNGDVKSFYVQDVIGADVQVNGSIGTMRGRRIMGGNSLNSGRVYASNSIDLEDYDEILGGDGEASGQVAAKSEIKHANFRKIIGGSGIGSGGIVSYGSIQLVSSYPTIGDENSESSGSVIGGSGSLSGSIMAFGGSINGAHVIGNLRGGAGQKSGIIYASTHNETSVSGNVFGGSGSGSGSIEAGFDLLGITIGGNLIGGTGDNSGQLRSHKFINKVEVMGSVAGSMGYQSGAIICDADNNHIDFNSVNSQDIASVRIHGQLLGGKGGGSGIVWSNNSIGTVIVDGKIVGGQGNYSGGLSAGKTLSSIEVGSDVLGGLGAMSGFIESRTGTLDKVLIHGSLIGGQGLKNTAIISGDLGIHQISIGFSVIGKGAESAQIVAPNGGIDKLFIGQDLVGGLSNSGLIKASALIDQINIANNLRGGNAFDSNHIEWAGAIIGGSINSIHIGGDMLSGAVLPGATAHNCGEIRSNLFINSLTIDGSIVGNSDDVAVISSFTELGRMRVHGSVEWTNILVGDSGNLNLPFNANGHVGLIHVDFDWRASNLAVGVQPGADHYYGTNDDAKLSNTADLPTKISTIDQLIVDGDLIGTPSNTQDHFGIVAEWIKKVSIHGTPISLSAGVGNDNITLNHDVTILELSETP